MADVSLYCYVSENVSQRISVWRLSPEDGVLSLVQSVPVGGKVMPMAISPDRRFLYAALRSVPYTLIAFAINALDGTLTLLGTTAAPDSIVYLCTDQTGRFLLSACNPPDRVRRTGMVTIHAIGTDGFIQQAPLVVRAGPKLHSVIADPTNRFVFACSCDGDVVHRYAFDTLAGSISDNGLAPQRILPKSGPRHLRFHPSGRNLYVINEYDASITVFQYSPLSGHLIEIQTISALPPDFKSDKGGRGADLHFTPDGRWLYASVREAVTIAGFGVDPGNGHLTSIGHFETESEPRGFAIDPLGRYLIAAALHRAKLVVFKLDPQNGSLLRLSEYPTGEGPNWVSTIRLP